MLDLTGITLSCLVMMLIIIRAVRLDRVQPWFQTIKLKSAVTSAKVWQRKA